MVNIFGRSGRLGRLEQRQFWPSATTNNFGSSTTVTLYGTIFTVTSSSGSSTTEYVTTSATATSYSTATPALTTIFTPPASCLNSIVNWNGRWEVAPLASSQCFPRGWAQTIYFSPGICPSGYQIVLETIQTTFIGKSTATETVATCCPSAYTYNNYYGNSNDAPCQSFYNPSPTSNGTPVSLTTTTSLSLTMPYITVAITSSASSVVTSTLSANTAYTITGTGDSLRAASVQVRWQSTDQVILALLGQSTSASGHPNNTTGPFPGPSKPNRGGKIAAGVVVPIVVIALLVGAILFWRRRKRRAVISLTDEPETRDAIPSNRDGAVARKVDQHYQPSSIVDAGTKSELASTERGINDSTPTSRPWPIQQLDSYDTRSFELPTTGPAPAPVQPIVPLSLRAGPMSELPTSPQTPPLSSHPVPNLSSIVPPVSNTLPVAPLPVTSTRYPEPSSSTVRSESPRSTIMSQKQEPNVATLQQESNVTALQQEYARVKEEKTRLSRLQELSELEAKLKSQLDNYQLGEE